MNIDMVHWFICSGADVTAVGKKRGNTILMSAIEGTMNDDTVKILDIIVPYVDLNIINNYGSGIFDAFATKRNTRQYLLTNDIFKKHCMIVVTKYVQGGCSENISIQYKELMLLCNLYLKSTHNINKYGNTIQFAVYLVNFKQSDTKTRVKRHADTYNDPSAKRVKKEKPSDDDSNFDWNMFVNYP
jgi:hypothetical protein